MVALLSIYHVCFMLQITTPHHNVKKCQMSVCKDIRVFFASTLDNLGGSGLVNKFVKKCGAGKNHVSIYETRYYNGNKQDRKMDRRDNEDGVKVFRATNFLQLFLLTRLLVFFCKQQRLRYVTEKDIITRGIKFCLTVVARGHIFLKICA